MARDAVPEQSWSLKNIKLLQESAFRVFVRCRASCAQAPDTNMLITSSPFAHLDVVIEAKA